MQKKERTPRVIVLASPEFYAEYKLAFEKLDKMMSTLVAKHSRNIIVITDIGLKASKLIEKYVNDRGFRYYAYVPNRLLVPYIWKRSIRNYIRLSADYLIVFYYEDISDFSYAVDEAAKNGITTRLIDLSKYSE